MRRLLINPGTPQAWEIQLKPGVLLLGRGFASDVKLEDPSVSGSHCEIVVEEEAVVIRDLGSTNGTFVNRAAIQEATLESGGTIRLGSVEMAYYSDDGEAVRVAEAAPPPLPPRAAVAPPLPRPMVPNVAVMARSTARFCKFHPKSPARYLCQKCNRAFCELCVNSRNIGGMVKKICRSCGVECVPLSAPVTRAAQKGFFGRLPGAFVYPFRGRGLMLLISAAVIFALLDFASRALAVFLIGLLVQIIAVGYVFSYMQNIIHSTTSEDEEMPELPAMEGLVSACFRLLGTILISFGPAIVVLILAAKSAQPAMGIALIPAVIFGCVYFPMAFLAVAMKDSLMAANPLIVVPAMIKVPLEYLVTVILLGGIFGLEKVVGLVLEVIFPHNLNTLTTHSAGQLILIFGVRAAWSLISVYLLTVNTRVLGLLYLTKKRKLSWYHH